MSNRAERTTSPSSEYTFSAWVMTSGSRNSRGATATNMVIPPEGATTDALIQPEVMQAPVVWIASDAASEWNGRRIIAYYWDESLPLEERLEKCGAPAAWPQLGLQAVHPEWFGRG